MIRFHKFCLAILCLGLLYLGGADSASAQTPVTVTLKVSDGITQDSLIFGAAANATYALDTVLGERECPPFPPEQAFDVRFISIGGKDSLRLGSKKNMHPLFRDTQSDRYRFSVQPGGQQTSIRFSWPAGLGSVGGGYWVIMNHLDSVVADMTKDTSYTYPLEDQSAHIMTLFRGDAKGFLTAPYDSLWQAYDSKGKHVAEKAKAIGSEAGFTFVNTTNAGVSGLHVEFSQKVQIVDKSPFQNVVLDLKGMKADFSFALHTDSITNGGSAHLFAVGNKGAALKVGKWWWLKDGVMFPPKIKNMPPAAENMRLRLPKPNFLNMLQELYAQGIFAAPNGLVVGSLAPFALDYKTDKWFYKYIYHPKYTDVLKTLFDKSGGQTSAPHALDRDLKGKHIIKPLKTLPPSKGNNALIGAIAALKFNIAMNDGGKVLGPTGLSGGFSALKYAATPEDPAEFDGLTIGQIAARADSFMSCFLRIDSAKLLGVISRVNGALAAPFDTSSFSAQTILRGRPLAMQSILYRDNLNDVPPVVATGWVRPPEVPAVFSLSQNYPNPFNPATKIEFNLAKDAIVSLKVYNMLGQEVAILADREEFSEGTNTVQFEAGTLASGVYFYRLIVNDGEFHQVKKMMLMK